MGVAIQESGDALARHLKAQREKRQGLGSVIGLFPVLHVDDTPIHESLAICEWTADTLPDAGLWPTDTLMRARARAVPSESVESRESKGENERKSPGSSREPGLLCF